MASDPNALRPRIEVIAPVQRYLWTITEKVQLVQVAGRQLAEEVQDLGSSKCAAGDDLADMIDGVNLEWPAPIR